MKEQKFYIHKLREHLDHKQKANARYSIRAYARDLGLHSSTLSQILNGRRSLPVKDGMRIIEKLGLGEQEKEIFIASLSREKVLAYHMDSTESEEIKLNVPSEMMEDVKVFIETLKNKSANGDVSREKIILQIRVRTIQ